MMAWREICNIAHSNFQDYVLHNSYGLRFFRSLPGIERHPAWYKIPCMISVLATPGVKFAVWVDADSLFYDFTTKLIPADVHAYFIFKGAGFADRIVGRHTKVGSRWPWNARFGETCVKSNAFIVQQGEKGTAFLSALWAVFPKSFLRRSQL